MKTVMIENGVVREIMPEYALPVERWYGKAFAERCVEAPDEVGAGWSYDWETAVFSEPGAKPALDPGDGHEYPVQYTALELAQQEITDLELDRIEQGQQLTDLELMILGGTTDV